MIRIELRFAIWLAYGKKDVYSGGLIENFNDLEIDHIIPQSIDLILLKEKIAKYELGNEFCVDSIENLVPTFKIHNRQKSEMLFNESSERFFLAIAAGKKRKVEDELYRVIKNFKSREKKQFKESYKIINSDTYGANPSYFNSKALVALAGYLPSKFGIGGSCNMEFYEVGSMVTLSHEAILALISRLEHSVLEKQISYYYNDKSESGFIVLGTTSLHLKKDAYSQLLVILNDFLSVYSDYLKRYEVFFGISEFRIVNNEGLYLLKEINETEWQSLIEYSYLHDLDMHSDNEFYFNANPNYLIALDRDESIIKFKISHHAIIPSRLNKVMLLWHLPHLDERKYIESGRVWTAKQTLDWVEDVISGLKRTDSQEIKHKSSSKISAFLRFLAP